MNLKSIGAAGLVLIFFVIPYAILFFFFWVYGKYMLSVPMGIANFSFYLSFYLNLLACSHIANYFVDCIQSTRFIYFCHSNHVGFAETCILVKLLFFTFPLIGHLVEDQFLLAQTMSHASVYCCSAGFLDSAGKQDCSKEQGSRKRYILCSLFLQIF